VERVPRNPAASWPTRIATPLTLSPDLIVRVPGQNFFGTGPAARTWPEAAIRSAALTSDWAARGVGKLMARTYQASVGSLIAKRNLPDCRLRMLKSPFKLRLELKALNIVASNLVPPLIESSRSVWTSISMDSDPRLSHLASGAIGSSPIVPATEPSEAIARSIPVTSPPLTVNRREPAAMVSLGFVTKTADTSYSPSATPSKAKLRTCSVVEIIAIATRLVVPA
jgi:hypothetical protein